MSFGQTVNKPGRWTKEQIAYMEKNYKKVPIDDMAKVLEKNPKTVRKYCVEKLGMTEEARISIIAKFNIQSSPVWHEMKQQFTPDELELFMYHWQEIMVQFKHDALPTERMQMVEIVRLEILLNRNMVSQKAASVTLNDTLKERDKEMALGDLKDSNKVVALNQIIAAIETSLPHLTRVFKELLERKQNILKEMRGTREQRIKRIEDSKETIQTWMASIVENEDIRKNLGEEMAKGRLAMYKELERLSGYHNFGDNSVEQVITSEETLKEDNI